MKQEEMLLCMEELNKRNDDLIQKNAQPLQQFRVFAIN